MATFQPVVTDVETARAAYAAFGDRDVEALADWFDADVVWIEPPELPGATEYRGRERVVDYLASILRVWDEFRAEPGEIQATSDGVDVEVHIRARARASGVTVEDRVVHHVTMRDGKAARIAVEQAGSSS